MKESPLRIKSYEMAKFIVATYKYLVIEKKEFVMSKQLLRSDTNPGAMVREAHGAESRADFIHKLKIAQKETNETLYWLELLKDTGYLEENKFRKVYDMSSEVIRLLVSSIKTLKSNS